MIVNILHNLEHDSRIQPYVICILILEEVQDPDYNLCAFLIYRSKNLELFFLR